MAPLVTGNDLNFEWSTSARNISILAKENIPLGNGTAFTHAQDHTLQALAVTFASFSLACSLVTSYWFLRMRRSFRHDLIMLLIQSDTWKALWLMMYPVIVFAYGPISNKSAFCQVNGFMFSLGVEASDFSVLMIAVHSLLNIFKRSPSSGAGLYHYRYVAYFLWVAVPVTLASVAFVNDSGAYVASITYCYLPVRPFWYRLALSWIPRYCIFIIIMVIYASIYFYVRFRFETFQRTYHSNCSTTLDNATNLAMTTENRRRRKRFSLPMTPKLMLHGLIPGSRSQSLGAMSIKTAVGSEEWKRTSASTVYSNQREGVAGYLPWMAYAPRNSKDSSTSRSQTAPPNTESTQSLESAIELDITPAPISDDILPAMPTVPAPTATRRGAIQRSSLSFEPVIGRPLPTASEANTSRSIFTVMAALRTHPADMTPSDSTPISQLELYDSNGEHIVLDAVTQTREKVRRQLRLLFIYPMVYIGMWTIPFVFHVLQYSEKYALHPPFALTCFVTIILAMQCAVDCLLFCSREKPWKHISQTSGGFMESFKFWEAFKANRRGSGISVTGRGGMSREEMVMQARRAYRRREEELAAELAARTALAREQAREQAGPSAERSWWDEGFDGASPPTTAGGLSIEEWDPLDLRAVRIPETVEEAEREAKDDEGGEEREKRFESIV